MIMDTLGQFVCADDKMCVGAAVLIRADCVQWLLMQEAKAVASVQSELENFQSEMQKASFSQRQKGQAAVSGAVQRAQRFVDRTLRLNNFSTLSAYVFGQGPLPVSKSFQVLSSLFLHHFLHSIVWFPDAT